MSSGSPLRVGLSTCPNDTFLFHALMQSEVRCAEEIQFTLADIEELNSAMLAGELDIAKVSTSLALHLAADVLALPVGWALGHGVGPVVLGSSESIDTDSIPHVLAPGEWTTAHLLWRLFHPEEAHIEQRVFSEIMPALERGEADLGVCIHEGRFTWKERGLRHVEDLGETWERETSAALPLGGLVARRDLSLERIKTVVPALRKSLAWALERPDAPLPTMRRHAQEASDAVLRAHVDLYVTECTQDLGAAGEQAFSALSCLASNRGLLEAGRTLEILHVD